MKSIEGFYAGTNMIVSQDELYHGGTRNATVFGKLILRNRIKRGDDVFRERIKTPHPATHTL
ncbi:MAG: hypothetical protein IJK54_03410, partial [Clostridia bacterium]|nr:hypothetical protein [Clostridia bacterium]